MCRLQLFTAVVCLCFLFGTQKAEAIKCYQCSSDEDKTNDNCGAYDAFDISKNTAIDCLGEEAVTPGTFCYKSIQQGPRGFIWDGRWRTVIRRCAQVSERGINWGCDWGYHENGVYWEECYCADNECNSSVKFSSTFLVWILPLFVLLICKLSYF
ncbi:uncharacterized protein B4U80_05373 [Leptotrombidium deliense]|uniref:Uncharacterized protein n=1 Tax=Leptotrombidium deliense TaxID=299467 RepID=A0A443SM58_9ACAR|nr:uncharacterized protein B4U80_05373 [Leptotrombidium deliense]